MRLSQVFLFIVAASATPFTTLKERTTDIEARQGTNLAGVVFTAVNSAAATIDTSLTNTQQLIVAAGSNVNAEVQAAIDANIVAIANALGTATQAITAAIGAAGGNVAGAVAGFTANQINQIVLATNRLITLLSNLGASLQVIINGLENVAPAVLLALQDEFALIEAAVSPFVAPVVNVAKAVAAINASVRVILNGFVELTPGLILIIGDVIDNS